MKVIGILQKTSKPNLYVLEGNSDRFLIKEELPEIPEINGVVVVYGLLNIKEKDGRITKFLNPRLVLSRQGKELWRATKASSPEVASEPSPPEPEGEEDFF